MTPTPTPAAPVPSVLPALSLTDWPVIVAVVFALVVIVIFFLRRHPLKIKELTLGPLKLEPTSTAPLPNSATQPPPQTQPSVKISGNTMIGQNKIKVSRDDAEVSNNPMLGKNEINVDADPNAKP